MKNHPKERRNAWRSLLLVVSAVSVFAGSPTSPRLWAQTSAPPAAKPQSLKAMEAAGIKMSFEVASVKSNNSGNANNRGPGSLGGLYSGPYIPPPGGLFSATNTTLFDYIRFAYDLTNYQINRLFPQLPKWATTNGYDIQARAEGNPTRAQMQLMLQSLLADRFKLVVHTETKEGPVYALVLLKPGKTGPQIQPDNAPCSTEPPSPASGATPQPPAMDYTAKFPTVCGLSRMLPSALGDIRKGGKHVTIQEFAEILTGPTGSTEPDRPVLDRTGLSGTYDISLEFSPGPNPDRPYDPVGTGPPTLEAVTEQLGMKLEATRAPLDVLVVDHVAEPSPN